MENILIQILSTLMDEIKPEIKVFKDAFDTDSRTR